MPFWKCIPDTLIQRCLVHKERNLQGYLSNRHWGELGPAVYKNACGSARGAEQAKEAAEAIEAFLSDKNAQAKATWLEAGAEVIALPRLDVSNDLHRSLLSTNCIENVFKKPAPSHREGLPVAREHRPGGSLAGQWLDIGLEKASAGSSDTNTCPNWSGRLSADTRTSGAKKIKERENSA